MSDCSFIGEERIQDEDLKVLASTGVMDLYRPAHWPFSVQFRLGFI